MITYEDFKKLDLRIATILKAEKLPDSEKLMKLEVDIGSTKRQIIAGIAKHYPPESLKGKQIVIVANLEPKKFTLRSNSGQVGLESQGMLLAADNETGPVLLTPEKEVKTGAIIK